MTVVASNYARKENDLIEQVKAALNYDPQTGEFRWRVDRALVKVGDRAGNVGLNGYERITVNYRSFYSHHLAIAFVEGRLPAKDSHVDHVNGDKTDNRYANLRVGTPSQNGLNRQSANRNSKSGEIGVCEVKPGRFVAYLTVNRKRRHLGTFDTLEQAAIARRAALAEIAS